MTYHLEVRWHALQLFADILPDSAQTGTARRAAAGLTITVVVAVTDLGQMFAVRQILTPHMTSMCWWILSTSTSKSGCPW